MDADNIPYPIIPLRTEGDGKVASYWASAYVGREYSHAMSVIITIPFLSEEDCKEVLADIKSVGEITFKVR